MIRHPLAVISLISLFAVSHAQDEQANDIDYYDMADSFSKCAALNDVMARMITTTEEEFIEHVLHMNSNGARVVALDMAIAGGYKKELVESLYEGHYAKFRDLVETSYAAGKSNALEDLQPEMEQCTILQEFQAEYIKEKRKQIYKSE